MRLFSTSIVAALALFVTAAASADSIQGSYVEARSTPGPSPADAPSQPNQPTRAVLAWQVRQGVYDGEKLDGQTIIAVVTAESSLGGAIGQTKTSFFVDSCLTAAQEQALVHLAKDLAPSAIHDAGSVVRSKLDVRVAEGCGCGAAVVECSLVKLRTRRLTDAEVAVVDNSGSQKPLGNVFTSTSAVLTEHSFEGQPFAAGNVSTVFVGSFSR
jgi:hypothetical protein